MPSLEVGARSWDHRRLERVSKPFADPGRTLGSSLQIGEARGSGKDSRIRSKEMGWGSTLEGLLSLPSGPFPPSAKRAEMLALPDAEKLGEPEEALEMGALWKMTSCVHFLKDSFLLTGRFWTG